MSFPSEKYEILIAEHKHQAEINEIFASGEFDGNIAVQYLREPNPVDSFEKEGEKAVIILIRDKKENKAVAMGACVIRNVNRNNEIVRMGYFTGLKIIPEYQKKLLFMPYVFQRIYELTKNQVDLYFTTILKENIGVQKMLEKPRKVMPLYKSIGNYRVYFCGTSNVHTGKVNKTSSHLHIRRCESHEIQDFYNSQAGMFDLSLESISSYDLKNAQFYALFERNEPQAVGYILNQQTYKQYVVKKYGGIYRLLSKIPTRTLGYPAFPKVNETARCASAGLWVKNNEIEYANHLWKHMLVDSKKYDFVMIGFHETHPLTKYFEKTKHIHYDSCCYFVDFERDNEIHHELTKKNLYIDVAFL